MKIKKGLKFQVEVRILIQNSTVCVSIITGDKSGAEAPGPSEFRISFKWFSKVSILEFFKRI